MGVVGRMSWRCPHDYSWSLWLPTCTRLVNFESPSWAKPFHFIFSQMVFKQLHYHGLPKGGFNLNGNDNPDWNFKA